jgi:hypothetical protein
MLYRLPFLICIFFIANQAFAQTQYQSFPIGFYNLENLFDTKDDENVRDTEFTPNGDKAWTEERYASKLKNMSSIIAQMGIEMNADGVIGLGVSEIENKGVLEDLVKEESIVDRNYQIVHYDSPDKRGIDVALLYFTLKQSQARELLLVNDGYRKYTRDVLVVTGDIQGEEISILVNHWPSRSGGEKRSAPGRKAAAELNMAIIDSLYAINPQAKIVIMGDLNDDPSSPSIKKTLNAKPKINKVGKGGLYNPMYRKHQRGEGSNAYRDSWSLFDQIIINDPLLSTSQEGLFFHKAEIFKKPEMLQKSGQYKNYPLRTFGGSEYRNGYSDHFPVIAFFLKKAS